MKKNKITYLFLLPLVLIIWGVVMFKIVDNIDPGSNVSTLQTPVKQRQKQIKLPDTLQLLLNYEDPFGSVRTEPVSRRKSTTLVVKKKSLPPPLSSRNQEIVWPSIQYSGMIKNQSKDRKLGYVVVNGASTLCSPGDSISGLLIGKIFNDSIVVYNGKEQKIITKK